VKRVFAGHVLAILLLPSVLLADNYYDPKFKFHGADEEEGVWEEGEFTQPDYPKDENLVSFYMGAATPHQYFMDKSSLSVGKDGVVRYIVVIKTASGTKNVNFEGMRCDAAEQKLYAFGKADGSWMQARAPKWHPIRFSGANNYQGVLYHDFLCFQGKPMKTGEDIAQLLIRCEHASYSGHNPECGRVRQQ
jgi:hypothetical protein